MLSARSWNSTTETHLMDTHPINCFYLIDTHSFNCTYPMVDTHPINCSYPMETHPINCSYPMDTHPINCSYPMYTHPLNCSYPIPIQLTVPIQQTPIEQTSSNETIQWKPNQRIHNRPQTDTNNKLPTVSFLNNFLKTDSLCDRQARRNATSNCPSSPPILPRFSW